MAGAPAQYSNGGSALPPATGAICSRMADQERNVPAAGIRREYLDYFAQAGGQINLEQGSGDAVQLMTVHAAKGLEFDQVFVLRLTHRGFPMAPRAAVLEFPEALMKEELPRGDFHIQEERRLFYVAITRARERLTLTTIVHKRSRPSVFLEDILSAPHVVRQNVEQAAPVLPPMAAAGLPAPADQPLFPEGLNRPRVYSRIAPWAERYRPPVFEPLQLSASAIETYQKCPQKYLFSHRLGHKVRPERRDYHWQRDAYNHPPVYLRVAQGPAAQFRRSRGDFPARVDLRGFRRSPPGGLYLTDGIEQLRAFYASSLAAPAHVIAQENRFAIE